MGNHIISIGLCTYNPFRLTYFSLSLVLPPGLLNKELPSSALQASILKNMFSSSTAAAVGSRITVYFPGSMVFAPTEPVDS
jgi:hypothetical protein